MEKQMKSNNIHFQFIIDGIYKTGIQGGVLGVKLLGAGGGGSYYFALK